MLFKLSLRNMKRSVKNYMVYFATLVLGVCIFYVFNSVETQTVMMKVSESQLEIIEVMNRSLSVVSVFISFVLGFLIVYASGFMIKRRKKEFGTYMILGMSKRKISTILLFETIFIGVISLVVGLIIGVIASQGMSVYIAKLFEADMSHFKFVVSTEAILKTLIYFAIIYVFVMMLNTFIVRKEKLINLLNAAKKSQKNYAKNPFLCVIVFAIAVYLLGTAYYSVTADFDELNSVNALGIQIVKGIAGTVLCFWSVSGMLVFITKRCKKYYYKGLNAFGIRELGNKINTTVVSGSIICILLFFAICILSCAIAIKNASNATLKENVPADLCADIDLYDDVYNVEEFLAESGFDVNEFKDHVIVKQYYCYDSEYSWVKLYDDMADQGMEEEVPDFIKLSDYNALARYYHHDEIEMSDNEYAIVANFEFLVGTHNKHLKQGKEITIEGVTYKPNRNKVYKANIEMEASNANPGVIVLPDNSPFFEKIENAKFDEDNNTGFVSYYLAANFKEDTGKTDRELADYYGSDEFEDKINDVVSDVVLDWDDVHGMITIGTKQEMYDDSIGLSAMVVFIGLYIGVIFLISSAAILSLKELSEASDSKEKYTVLRKIGVDEKVINRSLFKQTFIFFGFPLLLAVFHSIFGIQTGIKILTVFGRSGLTKSIIVSGGMILLVYGLYFVITYACCKKIIREK